MFNGFDFFGDENIFNEIFGNLGPNQGPKYRGFIFKDGKMYSLDQYKEEKEIKEKQNDLLKQEKRDKQDSSSVNMMSAEQMRKNAKTKRDDQERQKMADTLAFVNKQIKMASDRGLTSIEIPRSELTIELAELKKGYESLGYQVKETELFVYFDWS